MPSSYETRVRSRIARFAAQDRARLLAWRRAMYGEGAKVATEPYVRWLFEDGPEARERGPALWLFPREQEITAQQGAIRVTLQVAGERVRAAWLMDLMVRPEARRSGVGMVLGDAAQEDVGVAMGLDVSAEARRALLRRGWIDVGMVPLWVRPLTRRALAARVGRVAGAASVLLRVLEDVASAARGLTRAHLERAREIDKTYDEHWASVEREYKVIVRRDRAWLEWRYGRFPFPRYELHHVKIGARRLGWVVLRVSEADLTTGYIVDFSCAPKHTYTLLACAMAELRERRCDRVQCLHSGAAGRAAFFALGFLPRPSGWDLMIQPQLLASDRARALASDMDAWFITAGDADVDRPREGTVFA